ncbi:hypothetical protein ACET3Z_026076 [Daucus carota]
MDEIPKFVKMLSRDACRSNILKKSQFFGIKELFSDFSVTGGQLLVFTYSGGFMFDLCIIGVDGGEIQYPPIVHKLQDCSPQNVSIREIGWSFIRGVTTGPKVVDEVELPTSFVEHLGRYIPADLEIFVSCGVKILGGHNRKEKKINGLSSLCNMVGYRHLNSFNVLLLTYYGREKFTVSAFDSAMVEIFVESYPCFERFAVLEPSFEIVVQPFHLFRYSYRVDIPSKFSKLSDRWDRLDYITVYEGKRCWKLQVRARRHGNRMCIHDGWIKFRSDMRLAVRDAVKFIWQSESIRNFDVLVLKKVQNVD